MPDGVSVWVASAPVWLGVPGTLSVAVELGVDVKEAEDACERVALAVEVDEYVCEKVPPRDAAWLAVAVPESEAVARWLLEELCVFEGVSVCEEDLVALAVCDGDGDASWLADWVIVEV